MEYSGVGGKLIHEKNQKQKISCHCPFKQVVYRSPLKGLVTTLAAWPILFLHFQACFSFTGTLVFLEKRKQYGFQPLVKYST